MYQKRVLRKDYVDLLLIKKEGKRHSNFIKDFNPFMFDHILHRGRKNFCRYCFEDFRSEKMLKRHVKDCFKINDKQRIKMP